MCAESPHPSLRRKPESRRAASSRGESPGTQNALAANTRPPSQMPTGTPLVASETVPKAARNADLWLQVRVPTIQPKQSPALPTVASIVGAASVDYQSTGAPTSMSDTSKARRSQDPLAVGLAFLVAAVNDFADDVPHEKIKFGLVNLFTGVEILLKVRLAREHWSLVFKNVSQATRERHATGDFVSATYQDTVDRLNSICSVEFRDDHKRALELVRKERNKLLHIGYMGNPSQLRPVAAKSLEFLTIFIAENLEPIDPNDESHALLKELRTGLAQIQHYMVGRRQAIDPILAKAYSAIVECSLCLEEAMHFDDGHAKCEFCQFTTDGENAADMFATSIFGLSEYRVVKQGGEWPVHQCPECGQNSFLEGVASEMPHTTRWVCFSCGTEANDDEVWRCSRCYEPVTTKDGPYAFCDVCSFA